MLCKSPNPKFLLLCCLAVLSFVLAVEAHKAYAVPRDCPSNEFYTECGDSCQTECSTLGQPCQLRYFRCPDGCYCNKGYARDGSGKCIPIADCPK